MSSMLYSREIEDELMIQFIIMYALDKSDEPIAYSDLLNVIQTNCEISFTDMQLGLDNLVQTKHVTVIKVSDILSVYKITEKGKNVIEFFYRQIPLIIREPIDKSIKQLYIEKRRNDAIQATIEPINKREFMANCKLCDDDKMTMMELSLYAGGRNDAERMVRVFKNNALDIYNSIIKMFEKDERG